MLDVDLGDLIDYFATDGQTRSIVVYVESIKNARKFMSAARGIARAKPIVVVKAGRFPGSAGATVCHTGALSGEDNVHDAAFRRVGVVRVEAISDLFNCAEALAMQPNPKGPNLTIITNAGGPGIMATDYLVSRGGKLSSLSSETIRALKSVLPSYCSTANPIDILEEADPERFKKVTEICFRDPNSDGFLFIYTPLGATSPVAFARTIVELSKQTIKPVLTSLVGGGECWKARRILQKNGTPSFMTPEQAVATFMYMYSYTQNLELLYQTPEELRVESPIPKFLKEVLKRAFINGRIVLNLPESLQFLFAYGIPTIGTVVARTSGEAEALASELCCPVVMKVLSPQISHKSKAGGVILNVWSASDAKAFFNELAEKVREHDSQADFQGVAIQPMIRKKGYELLIGSKKDPQFGSVIVFGMGGTAVELFKDISVGFPPLNRVLARRIIERTAIYRHAASGGNSFDLKLLEEILAKFSQLVIDFPEIKEMDINPLFADENNVVAVDARIMIDSERILQDVHPHEHLVMAPYPNKYVTKWKLKDGTPVVLRPVKPEDETLFQELFKSLSEDTMRFRFFQIIKDVTHEFLTRLCNIDYDREMAIVAETQQDKKRIIGAVRLIAEPGRNSGEFAVVVGDEWQGQGLGSKLLDYVIDIGKDIKLEEIYGYVVSDNVKMIHLCASKGFKMEPVEEGVAKAVLKLS
jgi:acetyltransferase